MIHLKTYAKMTFDDLLVKMVSPTEAYVCDVHGATDGTIALGYEQHVEPHQLLARVRGRNPSIETILIAPCHPAAVARRYRDCPYLKVVGDWEGPTWVDVHRYGIDVSPRPFDD